MTNLGKTGSISSLFQGQVLVEDSANLLAEDLINALALLEDAGIRERLLKDLIDKYVVLERRVDKLLKNTLPEVVADEIKSEGEYAPRQFEVTILFMDCAGFTKLAEAISAEALIGFLHRLFTGLDECLDQHGGTKVKTIGDAYMAVFGAPTPRSDHAEAAVRAAIAMLRFVEHFNQGLPHPFQLRTGIHSGPVMGGVVGRDRMQFDIFGDTVNTASRFESSGEKGRINVSETTYQLSSHSFRFEARGEIALKNKAPMKAFFVTGER